MRKMAWAGWVRRWLVVLVALSLLVPLPIGAAQPQEAPPAPCPSIGEAQEPLAPKVGVLSPATPCPPTAGQLELPSRGEPLDLVPLPGRIAFHSNRDDNWELYRANADGTGLARLTNAPGRDQYFAVSPNGGKIAFTTYRDGNAEIYVMNADGSGQTNLTQNGAWDEDPDWSPDGSKIVFRSWREKGAQLYVMSSDGSGVTRLTDDEGWYKMAAEWSPDGSKIAYRQHPKDEGEELYVINADGSNPIDLSNNPNRDTEIAWAPDSTKIAFPSDRDGDWDIYVVNTDGSGLANLTNNDDSADVRPTWSPGGSQIAYDRWGDIWAMDADGSDQHALLERPGWQSYPQWSPDGGKIAFRWNQGGRDEVYVMNADGSNPVNVSNNIWQDWYWDSDQVWAPDGSWLTFVSERDGGSYEVYSLNPDGTGLMRLTNSPAYDIYPAYSPDGTKIAFVSDRDGDRELYSMNADGSGLTRLTVYPATDMLPAWSPDGSKIAFASDRYGNWDIYVMNADGSSPVRLTTNSAQEYYPTWSPDGSKLAFTSNRDGNDEIYVMNADGSDPVNLTNHGSWDWYPAWSRDGNKIAFATGRNGAGEIYVMNADGSNPVNLTQSELHERAPAWSPDSSHIVYSVWMGRGELAIMRADGTGQTRLTMHGADDSYPTWGRLPGLVAETELGVGLTEDGVGGVQMSIQQVKDPVTGEPQAVNIGGYDATLLYNPNGINVLQVWGQAPFEDPVVNIKNEQGKTLITAWDNTGAAAPVELARVPLRLVGPANETYKLVLRFDSMAEAGTGARIFQEQTNVKFLRRGDVRPDGQINIGDVLFGAQFLAGLRQAGEALDKAHMVNFASIKHDFPLDVPTISDVLYLAQLLAEMRGPDFIPAAKK